MKYISGIMKNVTKKEIYLLFVFVIGLLFLSLGNTYAKFSASYEIGDNKVGVSLDFNINITNIEEYQEIEVEAGESKKFNVKITNNLGKNAYYGVWYRMVDPATINHDIAIGKLKNSSTNTSGSISSGITTTITLVIKNDTSDDIKVDIGIATSDTAVSNIEYLNGKRLITREVYYQDTIVNMMRFNATLDNNIDFSKTSQEVGTNGIYIRSGTQNDNYPIYYYRGSVDNNIIFADMCFKIIRTTESGGTKLIYNGLPTNGECNAIGSSTSIGSKEFNLNSDSLAYAGYMYGTVYSAVTRELGDTWLYGSDVSYSGGKYTLAGETQTGYNAGLDNYHYTCESASNSCTSVKYVFSTVGITLSDGKKIEDALSEMLDYNTTSSNIKGDKDTEGTVDNWYYNKIEKAGYNDYVEDTVFCNDRSISNYGGWNSNGGKTSSSLEFGAVDRVKNTYEPSLVCEREIDRFTVNSSNGNGSLTYPVGLITADEVMLAGGVHGISNSSYYLCSGEDYWVGTPGFLSNFDPTEFFVELDGTMGDGHVLHAPTGIRPVISLKSGTKIVNGDGTVENPYVIK